MDVTHYVSQHFLTLIDCGLTKFTIWRSLVRQDSSSVIRELESIFYEMGPPEEILTDNDTAFCSMEFRHFVDEWGIRLRHQCAYVPSGNGIVERCHQSMKRIAARKACTIVKAVYRYNTTPKDAVTAASAPANAIHRYRVHIKGIDVRLPDRQGTRGPYELGDTVWVKPPNSQCTTSFRRGQITGIVSEQAVLVDGTPRHGKDIWPALNMNPLASSGSGESSNDELWIRPMPRVPDDPTANPDANADSSDGTLKSSDEEVQTIPLHRSARNKRPHPPCHMCDLETRGECGHESETNSSSWQKRVRLCLACRSVIWYEGRNTVITGWKKRKILTAISIIHLQPILKEKREEAPDRNFYRLRKWIMGRVTWIKTDSFFFVVTFFSARSRSRKEGGRGTKEEAQREREERRVRERRRKVEEERKEGSGVASTGLKSKDSWFNPCSTLREIIHPKTTTESNDSKYC